MKHILPALLVMASTPVLAQPMSGEITAACMNAMGETEQVCGCVEEEMMITLSDDQLVFLLAILTEDQTKLEELEGSFTNDDAQGVQSAMITAGLACMG